MSQKPARQVRRPGKFWSSSAMMRHANAILVIEGGDHADLLRQQGRYCQLYTGQTRME